MISQRIPAIMPRVLGLGTYGRPMRANLYVYTNQDGQLVTAKLPRALFHTTYDEYDVKGDDSICLFKYDLVGNIIPV